MSIIARAPSGWSRPTTPGEEVAGEVSVSDVEGGLIRHAFVRFVPRAEGQAPVRSFTAEATIDVDEDGNIMGIMVAWDVS